MAKTPKLREDLAIKLPDPGPKKRCFVISEIGSANSAERRRADGVLDEIIRPAIEPLGYRVERADHDASPGVVTESIIGKLLDWDLVVADLTRLNPNVMYELAVRHMIGEPFIQMMEASDEERLPFDIRGNHTVFFEGDLCGRREAVRSLKAAADAVIKDGNVGNPIKHTIDLKALEARGDPSTQALVAIVEDLQRSVSRLTMPRVAEMPVYPPRSSGRAWMIFADRGSIVFVRALSASLEGVTVIRRMRDFHRMDWHNKESFVVVLSDAAKPMGISPGGLPETLLEARNRVSGPAAVVLLGDAIELSHVIRRSTDIPVFGTRNADAIDVDEVARWLVSVDDFHD